MARPLIAIGATVLLLLCAYPGSPLAIDAECLADAAKLAIQTGASIDRQASVVFMRHPAAEETLKPTAGELAHFRGVKVECHAFARAGGGGSVTIYSKQVRP